MHIGFVGLLCLHALVAHGTGANNFRLEVESAVKKELEAWRQGAQYEGPDLGAAQSGRAMSAETRKLGLRIGEDSEMLHRVGDGDADKTIKGSLTVKGQLTAERVVVREALSAPGIPASSITAGSAKESAGLNYMLSGLHCHWQGSKFQGCPSSQFSWNGVANMVPGSAKLTKVAATSDKAAADQLSVEFGVPYAARPICSVQFQDEVLYAKVHATTSKVQITIEAGCGCPKLWAETNSWLTILCHGSAESQVANEVSK